MKKIAIALSGGVDSSVSAWILKKLNYDVTGIFIINSQKNIQCIKEDIKDIFFISKILNIKIKILNFNKFYKKIFKKILKLYKLGFTPNPDILCNKKIKFGILIDYIKKLKINKLATGHYAKLKIKTKNKLIEISKDLNKDQTYFLYKLNNYQISKLVFPLGNIYKKDVRIIAKKIGLPNFNKKDSTGICFLKEKNFKILLKNYIKINIGFIFKNYIIGVHNGFYFYTIGEKIKIKLKNKLYIFKKHIKKNIIYVININNKKLYSKGVIIEKLIFNKTLKDKNYFLYKIKHTKIYSICYIRYINKKKLLIIFDKPKKSISLEQHLVIYNKNKCLGGGIIKYLI